MFYRDFILPKILTPRRIWVVAAAISIFLTQMAFSLHDHSHDHENEDNSYSDVFCAFCEAGVSSTDPNAPVVTLYGPTITTANLQSLIPTGAQLEIGVDPWCARAPPILPV